MALHDSAKHIFCPVGAVIAPGASMSESRHSHRVNHAFAEHPPFEGTARVFDDLTDK